MDPDKELRMNLKVEKAKYPDLHEHLSKLPEGVRCEEVRYLTRLALEMRKGGLSHAPTASSAQQQPSAEKTTNSVSPNASILDMSGLNNDFYN
ncbi:hypothetical protein K0504_10075 [Neiella marina]|uniref:Uncharacterized protein n=1 Tax=Neiella holothuriorum TaxID=2870530 RepID=A0ABS7EGI4_9GAMM|nr:hypothetical protein [Neiella holothuriorum]MBW8191385.1 hypothetical protein [Neiella holothuriorum]